MKVFVHSPWKSFVDVLYKSSSNFILLQRETNIWNVCCSKEHNFNRCKLVKKKKSRTIVLVFYFKAFKREFSLENCKNPNVSKIIFP